MKNATEVLEELTQAVEQYNASHQISIHFPHRELDVSVSVAREQMFTAMRRARSRLNHRDTLDTAYNRLRKTTLAHHGLSED